MCGSQYGGPKKGSLLFVFQGEIQGELAGDDCFRDNQ